MMRGRPGTEIPFGAQYGHLHADGECRRRRPNGKIDRLIHCVCDCGGESLVTPADLVRGHTTSCGCWGAQMLAEHNPGGTVKHGLVGTPMYVMWQNITNRCRNPEHPGYKNYGARGITLWEPWNDPARFVADVLAEIDPRPEGEYPSGMPLYSIDRIDNDGNYEPGNIRWATKTEQLLNGRWRRPVSAAG